MVAIDTSMAKRTSSKRELINTGSDKRFIRRGKGGTFKESDDVGRSLAQDRGQRATNIAKKARATEATAERGGPMSWLNQVTDIMQKYASTDPAHIPASVNDDFDRFSRSAPPSSVSQGLAEAFRSTQTPPFASMLGRLFERSPAIQKTSVLNTLIAA
jgi:hypothetical protein